MKLCSRVLTSWLLQLVSHAMLSDVTPSPPTRAWYKPYLTTLLAVGIVIAGWGYSQTRRQTLMGSWGHGWQQVDSYRLGWPLEVRQVEVTRVYQYQGNLQFTSTSTVTASSWKIRKLVFNSPVGLVPILSTAVMCERWRRNHRRVFQFSRRTLMATVTVCSLLLLLYLKEFRLTWWCFGPQEAFFGPKLNSFPWYLMAPMLFGLGCTLCLLGLLLKTAAAFLWRKLSRQAVQTPENRGLAS